MFFHFRAVASRFFFVIPRRCWFILLFFLVGFVGSLSVSATNAGEHQVGPESGRFVETEKLIAEIPEGAALVGDSVQPRPRDEVLAYVLEDDHGFRVCMNNACGPCVDRVARGMPIVSRNGKHLAAVVRTGEDARVMLGGDMSDSYDMVYGLRFSPDSMILAYIAKQDEAFSVYVNQDRHEPFAAIDLEQGLVFSPDSSRMAYVASRDGQSWHLVENGEPGDAFDRVKHVTYSDDSNRLAYAAEKDGKWHIVEEGETGPAYKDILRIAFGPESRQLAYIARDKNGVFVVKNGEKSATFDHIVGDLLFSADGERLAYAVAEERRGGVRMRMVADGETGPWFDKIGGYWFSLGEPKLVYMAIKDEKGRIVEENDPHEAYDSVGVPAFDTDGRHMAYRLFSDGQMRVKKDGEKGPAFDYVDDPVFCPNGERMAYLARKDDKHLVVEDGEIVDSHQQVSSLTFSPDGKHLAYIAVQGGQTYLAVDGKKGKGHKLNALIRPGLVFTEDNIVQMIAVTPPDAARREVWLIRAEMSAE